MPEVPPTADLGPDAESWFRTLADTASVAIFVYRERILWANRATEALTGYSAAELAGMPTWEPVHPDHRQLVRERIEARLRGEPVPSHYEVKLQRKNGEERWMDFTAGAVHFHGALAGLGTAYDITERKQTEMALRESERRLQLAQSAAGSVVWEWNLDTDRLTVSEHARELFGVEVDSLARTGAEHLQLMHPDDRGRIQEAIRRLLKHDEDIHEEIQFLRESGRPVWLAERARGIRDPATGRVQRIVGVAHDITDRKLGEMALRASEEKYRLLVEQQSDLVVKLDGDGRITYLSPSAISFFGRDDAAYQLGKRVFEASGGAESESLRRAWESLRRPPHLATFEHRAVAAGQVRWLSWNCRGLLGPDGALAEVVAVGRDVTERRLAEEALYEEKERAQVTLASIGDGVIRTDALGLVDYLNPVAEQLTGWTLAEAYGRLAREIFHIVDGDTRRPLPDPAEQLPARGQTGRAARRPRAGARRRRRVRGARLGGADSRPLRPHGGRGAGVQGRHPAAGPRARDDLPRQLRSAHRAAQPPRFRAPARAHAAGGPRRGPPRTPSATSISTSSRWSTTPAATSPATSCSSRSRRCCSGAPPSASRWRAWAATNSAS